MLKRKLPLSSPSLHPLRAEAGESRAGPFGSDDNGAGSIWPLPRPRLGSSLAQTNQRQMCRQAGCSSSRWGKKKKRKDDASAGRQKPKRSGRWPSPSHQTGTNEEAGPQSQQARHKRGDIKSERASAFVRPTIRSEERCQCHHLPVEAALHSALLLKGRQVCGNMTGGAGGRPFSYTG